MRFYNLSITGAKGASSSFTLSSLSSNGNFNPAALNIEFDATVYAGAIPQTLTTVRIWGVPLLAAAGLPGINQASDLNGATVLLKAGMSTGPGELPDPSQQGPILSGIVFQAFGNWVNTDMTIDLVVSPNGTGLTSPPDGSILFVLNWKQGQTLQAALTQTFSTAYPGYTTNFSISPNLVAPQDFIGCYNDPQTFNAVVKAHSLSIIKTAGYNGVDIIILPNNVISVSDGTVTATSVKQLVFKDLIGQPTWIGPGQVQFSCPVRADVQANDTIKFPALRATQTAAELGNQPQDQSSFQGTFVVNLVRHVGNFRQPNAVSWISTFNAYASGAAVSA